MIVFRFAITLWKKFPHVITLMFSFAFIGGSIHMYRSTSRANVLTSSVITEIGWSTDQSINLRDHLRDFEAAKWYAKPRNTSTMKVPIFPPQMTIVKMCSMCNTSYWMAFPTNLTLQYYCFGGENSMFIELARGFWDTAETRLANAVLSFGCRASKSPALMVDVGMNIGYFSAMALAAGCRVVAFEPTKYHHPYALVTAMLSGHGERFTLHKLAASNISGEKIPFDDWSFSETAEKEKRGQTLPYVYTTRVDDVVQEDVLYLKVDVEGHEPVVFQGLIRLLSKKTVLVIVWEDSEVQRKEPVELPANQLKRLGYFISELHHGGAGNFVALHPKVDPVLRETIMAMKEVNIRDSLAGQGLNWWDYQDRNISC